MSIRLSKTPFWQALVFCIPIIVLIMSPSIVYFILFLANRVSFEKAEFSLFFAPVFLSICLITSIILYIIWRKKNPKILVLDKDKGMIISKKEVLYRFSISKVNIYMFDYNSFLYCMLWVLLIHQGVQPWGASEILISLDDGEQLRYIVGIFKSTAKRIEKHINKYKETISE